MLVKMQIVFFFFFASLAHLSEILNFFEGWNFKEILSVTYWCNKYAAVNLGCGNFIIYDLEYWFTETVNNEIFAIYLTDPV